MNKSVKELIEPLAMRPEERNESAETLGLRADYQEQESPLKRDPISRHMLWVRIYHFLVLALVLLAPYSLYRQVPTFDLLVYDDLEHIVYNPMVNTGEGGPSWKNIWGKAYFDLYVPVAYSVWASLVTHVTTPAERQVDPLKLAENRRLASTLHGMNIILHELCTGLVFSLLLQIGATWVGAALGALLFAIHPLQVESVAWISEGRGLLATALGFSAILLWLYCDRRRKFILPFFQVMLLQGGAWLLFVASVLSKPSTVVLPLFALILGGERQPLPIGRKIRSLLPWILVSALVSFVTKSLQKDLISPWSWWERGLLAADSLGFYLSKIVWPGYLLPDYSRQPTLGLDQGLLLLASIGIGYGLVRFKDRLPAALTGTILLLVAGLSPQLGIFPSLYQSVSTVADRYAYLGMVGPAYGLAQTWTWAARSRRFWIKSILATATLGWLVFLSDKTIQQIPLWRGTESLFLYNIEKNPESFTAPHALGDLAMLRGDFKKAIRHYRQAIHARPYFAQAHASLGHALLEDKNPDEAKIALKQSVALYDQNPSARLNLGVSLQRTGDNVGAEAEYLAANKIAPHPLAFFNLGGIYLQRGEWDRAETAFLAALAINPRLLQAHKKLAEIYDRKGMTLERERHRREAAPLTIRP